MHEARAPRRMEVQRRWELAAVALIFGAVIVGEELA
jgi:hypothetical protein